LHPLKSVEERSEEDGEGQENNFYIALFLSQAEMVVISSIGYNVLRKNGLYQTPDWFAR
jgi:hypothetical protein